MELLKNLECKYFSLLIILLIAITAGCNPMKLPIIKDKVRDLDKWRTEEFKKTIKDNPSLQELDNVCREIPVPQTFKFFALSLSPNESPVLTYFYYSEDDFDKSDFFFREHFKNNKWKEVENNSLNRISEFRNDSYKVSIQYGGIGEDANYGISCRKLVPEKVIKQ